MSPEEAQLLWDELVATGRRTDDLLLKIIESEAWLPLGYLTLAAAWSDLMGDYTLIGRDAQVAVAMQMIKDDDIIKIRGLGSARMSRLRGAIRSGADISDLGTHREWLYFYAPDSSAASAEEKDHFYKHTTGLCWPAADRKRLQEQKSQWEEDSRSDTYLRRAHRTSFPSAASSVHVDVGVDQYERYRRIAEARGSSVHREVARAVSMHFDRLERELSVSV